MAVHLRGLSRKAAGGDAYPFTVPVVRALEPIELDTDVTFFVGENGSGKSTLLEGIAAAAGLPAVGSASVEQDATLGAARALGAALRLSWRTRVRRGFFLRAEDFFGFAKSVAQLRIEFERRLAEIETEFADASEYARGLAMGPARASLAALERRYGADLDANSHGQAFLTLFRSRFVPGGLYLLDEPEAPLSPNSQLALLLMIREMVAQDAQFIIATHAPILLAYPGARILSFDETPVREVPFDELDHVRLTRDVLNDPSRVFRRLFDTTD